MTERFGKIFHYNIIHYINEIIRDYFCVVQTFIRGNGTLQTAATTNSGQPQSLQSSEVMRGLLNFVAIRCCEFVRLYYDRTRICEFVWFSHRIQPFLGIRYNQWLLYEDHNIIRKQNER